MGTAVVQPHDCLSPSQGRQSRNFLPKTAAPSLEKNPSSLQYTESSLSADFTWRRSLGNVRRDRSLPDPKGLLPPPSRLAQRAFSSFRRTPSEWRMREILASSQFNVFWHQKSWIPYHECCPSTDISARAASIPLPLAVKDIKRLHGSNCSYYRKKELSHTGCYTDDKPHESLCRTSGKRLGHKRQLRRSASEHVSANRLRHRSREEVSLAYAQVKVPLQFNYSSKGEGTKNGDCVFLARTSRTLTNAVEKCKSFSSLDKEKWASPSFFNSPSPSSLPIPSFTKKQSITFSRSLMSPTTGDHAAQACSISIFEAKRSWNVAFATEDLRRLLHLDRTC